MSELVAYRERSSCDPITGEDGILRDEWEVRLVRDCQPEELEQAWGPGWRRNRPFALHALYHRYIRRGVQEPWLPFQASNSFEQALEYLPNEAAACCPELVELQERQKAAAEAAEQEIEAERKGRAALAAREDQAKASQLAWRRLLEGKSAAGARLAVDWNAAIMKLLAADELKHRFANDAEFVRLHEAVIAAVTVPDKRKAIREALSWLKKEGVGA